MENEIVQGPAVRCDELHDRPCLAHLRVPAPAQHPGGAAQLDPGLTAVAPRLLSGTFKRLFVTNTLWTASDFACFGFAVTCTPLHPGGGGDARERRHQPVDSGARWGGAG